MRLTIVLFFLLCSCITRAQQPKARDCNIDFPRKKPLSKPDDPTPTGIISDTNFEGNKGKLYWPVANGYICDHFGTHPHALLCIIMIDNDGIDIRTNHNAQVRAVYEGEVSSITVVADEKMVVIRHGNYFTVYKNLLSTSVTKGQHVNALQPIGIADNNDEGDPTVTFSIWKAGGKTGSIKLDPEQWIAKPR